MSEKIKVDELTIDGTVYVPKDSITQQTPMKEGLTLCILRTYSAGVWYGYVDYEKANFLNAEVFEAVRVWSWKGAFTLSELSLIGTTDPNGCRFAVTVPRIKLNRVIEYLPVTEQAQKTYENVKRG